MEKLSHSDVREAVARFFAGAGPDNREQAARMIDWLDHCGYRIVPKPDGEQRQHGEVPIEYASQGHH